MKIYFVKDDKWYSKIIMGVMEEPVTHIGIGLFCDKFDLVIDCTKPYGKLYHFDHWTSRDKYQLVTTLELKLSEKKEIEIYYKLIDNCLLVPYDWGAYAYGLFYVIKKMLWNAEYPKKNPWAGEGKWCSEIIEPLKPYLKENDIDLDSYDLEIATPWMIYKELIKHEKIIEL